MADRRKEKPNVRPVVMPCVQKVSDSLKEEGRKHGVRVLFSATQKFSRLSMGKGMSEETCENVCGVQRRCGTVRFRYPVVE